MAKVESQSNGYHYVSGEQTSIPRGLVLGPPEFHVRYLASVTDKDEVQREVEKQFSEWLSGVLSQVDW